MPSLSDIIYVERSVVALITLPDEILGVLLNYPHEIPYWGCHPLMGMPSLSDAIDVERSLMALTSPDESLDDSYKLLVYMGCLAEYVDDMSWSLDPLTSSDPAARITAIPPIFNRK